MASFAWVLAILCAPTGCTRAVESSGERLADLIPIVEQGVSTDIILPPYRESLELLDHGWEEATAALRANMGSGCWVGLEDFTFIVRQRVQSRWRPKQPL